MNIVELNGKINIVYDVIDMCVVKLLGYQEQDMGTLLPALIASFSSVLPMLVESYTLPELAEYAADGAYWPAQLERIMGAFQNGDRFLAIDALNYELKENLREYQKLIYEKGLI